MIYNDFALENFLFSSNPWFNTY